MTYSALAAPLLLLLARAGAAPQPGDAATAVRGREEEMTAAFNAWDPAALGRLWDEDLVFVFPNGALAGKAGRLAGLKEAPASIPQSANESVDVRMFGDVAVAIVVSRWPGTRDGKPSVTRFRATHVWVKRGEQWRLVSAQVSPIRE
jgi:ketosteroid isomerase-like protein